VATLGHEQGAHAPGLRDPRLALYAAHHLLLSHGRAVEVLRRLSPGSEVGLALVAAPVQPFEGTQEDREAARRADGALNRWYLEPLFHASYPDDVIADRVRLGDLEGPTLPFVRDGDLRVIAAPIDFLGVNYYSRVVVRAGEGGDPVPVPMVPVAERTEMGWEVYPPGLRSILRRYAREYGARKLYVTENGAAFPDPAPRGGCVPDERRVDYLHGHLQQAHRAIAEGVPLAGYFVWSLLDNFEWAHGHTKRFGLYGVDFATQRRTPKESAAWYREVALANAVPGAVRELT
jgi:beta-glucosidase